MTVTAHVLIGGAIGMAVGAATSNPTTGLIASIVAGIASHFVMDTIPHIDHPPAPRVNNNLVWTPSVWVWGVTDSLLALLVTFGFWTSFFGFPTLTPFLLGAIGGALPDVIDNIPFWNTWLRRQPGFRQFHGLHDATHHVWHRFFKPTEDLTWPSWWVIGTVTQVVAVGLSLWYLLKG
jgi:hypothetical protein